MYFKIVEAIEKYGGNNENELCFKFINTVLEQRQQTIMDEYMQTVISGQNDVGPSDKFKRLIIKLV